LGYLMDELIQKTDPKYVKYEILNTTEIWKIDISKKFKNVIDLISFLFFSFRSVHKLV
jgi:hypothetical protein